MKLISNGHIGFFEVRGVWGYKNFKWNRIKPDVNILVGINGCGKTTLLNLMYAKVIDDNKILKYSKEHIVQMLLVYSLKNTLSISSIRRVLQGVYNEGFDGKRLQEGYDRYIDLKADNRARSLKTVREFIEDNGFDIEKEDDFFAFLLGLVSLSADLKNISIALLEERYPDLEALRQAELEAEKARVKAEKEEKAKSEKSAKQKKKNDEV